MKGKIPRYLPTFLLVCLLLSLLAGRATAQPADMTSAGYITTWLVLGPYTQLGLNGAGVSDNDFAAPGVTIIRLDYLTDGVSAYESTFFPAATETVNSNCVASGGPGCYVNPDFQTPTVERIDTSSLEPAFNQPAIWNNGGIEADTVNFETWWGRPDPALGNDPTNHVMGYAFIYVRNNTGADLSVYGQCASDDSIQVLIGKQTYWVNNIPRGISGSGTFQDSFPAVLKKGLNRVVVKVFEGAGGWNFRLRFTDAATCMPLLEPTITIETEPPADIGAEILATRTLPDPTQVTPGGSFDVMIDIEVVAGSPGATVVKEKLPPGFPFATANKGGSVQGGSIVWNLPAPLTSQTLTYSLTAPDPLLDADFAGTVETGGEVIDIYGGAHFASGSAGWILDWLYLSAIDRPVATNWVLADLTYDWLTDNSTVAETTVIPQEGLEIFPDFSTSGARFHTGQASGLFTPIVTSPGGSGCISFNPIFPWDYTMSYCAVYVTNPNDQPMTVYMGIGSDDDFAILVNGAYIPGGTAIAERCNCACSAQQPNLQTTGIGPATLNPGSNLILFKLFDVGGDMDFNLRLQDASGTPIVLPTSLEPGDYNPLQKVIRIVRDVPDDLKNGGTGTVTFTLTPVIDVGEVKILEELPAGLTASSPSNGGVLKGGGTEIDWDLGLVDTEVTLSYTVTVASDAVDGDFASTATIDGLDTPITGDLAYTGSTTFNPQGFIKGWLMLGPLSAPDGLCLRPAGNMDLDWLAEAGGATEATILPFPGLVTKPDYGATAAAAGLLIPPAPGTQVTDQYPNWMMVTTPVSTIDTALPYAYGLDYNNFVAYFVAYVTNTTGSDIVTQMGVGSDDSLQVLVNEQSFLFPYCRAWGAENEEQDVVGGVVLKAGLNRVMVKLSEAGGGAGFRLRFRDPAGGTGQGCIGGISAVPGLKSPTLRLSYESPDNPSPGSLARRLPAATYDGASPMDVSIDISLKASSGIKVHELIPAGCMASNPSDGGSVTATGVDWDLSSVTTKTLTYTLIPIDRCMGNIYFGNGYAELGSVSLAIQGPAALVRNTPDAGLPDPWKSADITSTGGGAVRAGDHEVFVLGNGRGTFLRADELHFAYTPASGNFDMSAGIGCTVIPDTTTGKVGVMARDTINPDSIYASMFLTFDGTAWKISANYRHKASQTPKLLTISPADNAKVNALPVYLRLLRTGTALSFQRSPDGSAWQEIATKVIGTGGTASNPDIQFTDNVLMGVWASGGSRGEFFNVSGPPFEEVSVNPPTNLTVVPSAKRMDLSWTAPASGPAPTSYLILRDGAQVGEVTAPTTTYADTGLADDTNYCYVVKSKAGALESGPSNQACAKTPPAGAQFRRGDSNDDSKVDLSDAIVTLAYLFQGGTTPTCFDATDADDSGVLDLTDGIYPLTWLFQGGPEPPAPGPKNCGPDTTPQKPGQKPFPACVYTKCP